MSNINNHLNKDLLDNKNSELIEGMLKTLTVLSNDVTKKKVELEKVKTKVKDAKFNYNQEVKIYQQLNQEIILNEHKKEEIEDKISKIKKKILFFKINLSKEFLQNFIEGLKKFKSIYTHFINFSGYSIHKELDFISVIFRDEYELKSIIEYSENYQNDLFNNSKKQFEELKNNILKYKEQNSIPYPFESIFEYMSNIYQLIDLNSKIKIIVNEINNKIEEKNKIFITLKKIEGNLVSNDKVYQEMKNYVKNINSIFENYQSIKKQNDISDYLKLAKKVNEFNTKNFTEYNEISNNDNLNINNMSVQSEFSDEKIDFVLSKKKFLTKKSNNSVSNSKINNINNRISLDKNINKVFFSKTHSRNSSRINTNIKSTTPIHTLKKRQIQKEKSPNYLSNNHFKNPILKKENKSSYNIFNKFIPFPINHFNQKTVLLKKKKKNDSIDNEKTERNDHLITNLITNGIIIQDSNLPFSIDNDSVGNEFCPYRNISALVIKNENGKISPIINRGIINKNNLEDFRIDKKVYSDECCMSCT